MKTCEPILVDTETVRRLMSYMHQEAKGYLDGTPHKAVDLQEFIRLYAQTLIEAAGLIGQDDFGVGFDLQKMVAYGLSNGALDMMYKADPDTMKKAYAERQDAALN
jgi:phage tail sheath protein FI